VIKGASYHVFKFRSPVFSEPGEKLFIVQTIYFSLIKSSTDISAVLRIDLRVLGCSHVARFLETGESLYVKGNDCRLIWKQ